MAHQRRRRGQGRPKQNRRIYRSLAGHALAVRALNRFGVAVPALKLLSVEYTGGPFSLLLHIITGTVFAVFPRARPLTALAAFNVFKGARPHSGRNVKAPR